MRSRISRTFLRGQRWFKLNEARNTAEDVVEEAIRGLPIGAVLAGDRDSFVVGEKHRMHNNLCHFDLRTLTFCLTMSRNFAEYLCGTSMGKIDAFRAKLGPFLIVETNRWP